MSSTQFIKQSRSNAQDQESDKKPKKLAKAQSTKIDPGKAKGRPVTISRNGSHPLPKQRNKLPPITVHNSNPKPRPNVQPKIAAQKPSLGKVSQQTASINRQGLKKPNSVRMSKEAIQERLKKKSPWFDSIMDPISGGGVKIPDPIGTETGTYQHVEPYSVKVNAGGVVGLRIVCPWLNSFPAISAPNGLNFQITSATATEANLQWGDGTNIAGSGFSFQKVPALMKANARTHRVVSACVTAQSEVSTLNDAGEMTAFVTPLAINPRTATYSAYQFQYDSTLLPVNTHKPMVTRWYPVEAEANLYNGDVTIPSSDLIVSYHDFLDPNDAGHGGLQGVIPWEIGVVCAGMTAGGVVRFTIVINYEFIPLLTTTMVTVSPSPVDLQEETFVNQWVSECPITEVVSQNYVSQAQSTSTVAEKSEPSGFGMLFNVIEESLPLLGKAAAALLL